MAIFGFLLSIAALALLAIALFLALEILLSIGTKPRAAAPSSSRPRGKIGVVIPAHNEQGVVAATVAAVRAQLRATDRIIVVADNCSDATAAEAGPAGADAIERHDEFHCGKGYALQFGVDHLKGDPPETVIFIDADCRPEPGALLRIADQAAYLSRPVQALYLMRPPEGAAPKAAVSAFAFLLMNRVRMSGLERLSGSSRLTGAGMAFPWAIVSRLNLAGGEIVEDLALTIRMIEQDAPPALDLGALVVSELPKSDFGSATQRARWEHGSLRMAAKTIPRLFSKALRGDFRALALVLDLAVPPLSVFAALLVGVFALSAIAALAGHDAALEIVLWAMAIFGASVALAWALYGRETLTPSALKAIGPYLAAKARVYGAEGRKSASRWTRTDRSEGA